MKSIFLSPHTWTNNLVRVFPIRFFQFYLGLTVFIFAFGPWPWPVPDPLILYFFLFAAHLALWFGYKNGLRMQPGGYYRYGRWTVRRILRLSLIVNFIWIIPRYMLALNLATPDFNEIYSSILMGLTDPGAAYQSRFIRLEDHDSYLLNYISILLSPILWMLLPLSILFWKKLSKRIRIAVIFIEMCKMLQWVAIGTTKGFADLTFILCSMLLAANPYIVTNMKLLKRKVLYITVVTISLVVLFVFFQYVQYGRSGFISGTIPYDQSAGIAIKKDRLIIFGLSDGSSTAIARVSSYMSQGYYGLSLALKEDFQWSYGVGNSIFLTNIFHKFFDRDVIFGKTYPARVEKYGWGAYSNWHTFYTWIASDVTFPGVIVVVFFIGKLLAMTWIDTLKKENPFAIALFTLVILMIFYFPANNLVLSFHFPAFFGLLFFWIITRKKRARLIYNASGQKNRKF